jgi:hypothetical protein
MNTIQEIAADIARELREDPTRWTQKASARDTTGYGVAPASEKACAWCLYGHIERRNAYQTIEHFRALDSCMPLGCTISWNDAPERTVDDVIALCDKVAAS